MEVDELDPCLGQGANQKRLVPLLWYLKGPNCPLSAQSRLQIFIQSYNKQATCQNKNPLHWLCKEYHGTVYFKYSPWLCCKSCETNSQNCAKSIFCGGKKQCDSGINKSRQLKMHPNLCHILFSKRRATELSVRTSI